MPLGKKNKKILIICPYPQDIAPGQRFRYEMYLDQFKDYNLSYEIKPFLDEETNKILFNDHYFIKKTIGVLKGFFRRLLLIFNLFKYDYIFLFREMTPIGPPIVEWIVSKVFKKKIIYDFDDAIWLPFKSEKNSITNALKWTSKVSNICKWSYSVIVGNEYLANFARDYNDNVLIIPTIVDTDSKHNKIKEQNTKEITIGWTGSHSTNKYLGQVLPVLIDLQKKYQTKFIFISNIDPNLLNLDYKFIPWKKDSEVEDLLQMNIGIMPLVNDEWSNGKCGFKAIQYLSLGIPAVVSPVGVNNKIVLHGETGFLSDSLEEWKRNLEKLILNADLRSRMGQKGRQHIVESYSKKATVDTFISVFN